MTGSTPASTDETERLTRANRFLPFPVLDSICVGAEGKGLKFVSAGERYFAAHFPEQPILPGVLIMGAVAAVAASICDVGAGGPPVRQVRRFRIHRPVFPGDLLEICVKQLATTDDGRWFEGTATVDGQLVARGKVQL